MTASNDGPAVSTEQGQSARPVVRDERERAICQVSAILHGHPSESLTWKDCDDLAAEIVSKLQGDGWVYGDRLRIEREAVTDDGI